MNTTLEKYAPKSTIKPLATISIAIAWQGEYSISITEHYVDIYQNGERISSVIRRYPDCLSKELHHSWLRLLTKFKLDENDMRSNPVGINFKRLQG